MLIKFYCWLFGHNFYRNFFTGTTMDVTDRLTGNLITVPVLRRCEVPRCIRCNVDNPNEKDKPGFEKIRVRYPDEEEMDDEKTSSHKGY